MDEGGVKLGAGGLIAGIVVALISRLRRPKSMALEDRRVEVSTLATAVSAMDTAMKQMSSRLDDCEEKHRLCEDRYSELESDIRVLNTWIVNNMGDGTPQNNNKGDG